MKAQNKKTKVYKLSCKRTPEIIYIGITTVPLQLRLFKHFCQAIERGEENKEKVKWILTYWKEIEIEEIEEIDFDLGWERESFFVLKYKEEGYNVLNNTYRAISIYANNGLLISNYSSIKEVIEKTGLDRTSIHRKIDTDKSINGYRLYSYREDKKIEEFKPERRGKKINQYDLSHNFIKEWSSIKEASRFLGKKDKATGIISCSKGIINSAYGFIWRYKNEPFIKRTQYTKVSLLMRRIYDYFNINTDKEILDFSKVIRRYFKKENILKSSTWDTQRVIREYYKIQINN